MQRSRKQVSGCYQIEMSSSYLLFGNSVPLTSLWTRYFFCLFFCFCFCFCFFFFVVVVLVWLSLVLFFCILSFKPGVQTKPALFASHWHDKLYTCLIFCFRFLFVIGKLQIVLKTSNGTNRCQMGGGTATTLLFLSLQKGRKEQRKRRKEIKQYEKRRRGERRILTHCSSCPLALQWFRPLCVSSVRHVRRLMWLVKIIIQDYF